MELVKGIEVEVLVCGFGAYNRRGFELESAVQQYDSMVLGGKIHVAV